MTATVPPLAANAPGRRMLKAGTTVLWRAPDVVQLELGTNRIVIENAPAAGLAQLLGSAVHTESPPTDHDSPSGGALTTTERDDSGGCGSELYDRLDELGFLRPLLAVDATNLPARLTPDLAALADGPVAAESRLSARRGASVTVHGTTRLAVAMASVLAAAGVGRMHLASGGTVSAADACPGGLLPADEGRRFAAAAVEALRRSAPEVAVDVMATAATTDLVVLTDPGPVDPTVRLDLHRRTLSHLAVSVQGRRAVLGPLVIPGSSSCLRCADLHRTERDPAWPLLAVQLSTRPRHREPSDVAVTTAVAGLAATHALNFLDGEAASCIGATIELDASDWRLRRRSWPAHPDCDCQLPPPSRRAGSRMNV